MTPADAEIKLLIQATRASLEPAPFPPRRDLSCAGAATGAADDLLFHDVFWAGQRRLCCYAARLPAGGADGGRSMAAAHSLKALMRAAVQRHGAEPAVAASLEALRSLGFPTADIDLAAAVLRIDTGEASLVAVGAGTAVRLVPGAASDNRGDHGGQRGGQDGGQDADRATRLACGQFLWLAVGRVATPVLAESAYPDDAEELVRAALAGTEGAAVTVGPKTVYRERGQIITLDNDVAQIGPVLAEIDAYLASQQIGEEARAGLDVALDEILTNIILYAYGDGQAHEIILHVSLGNDALRIDVGDDGTPFDPTAAAPVDTTGDLEDRPIGGLGLHFVRQVFDTVSYRRQRGWNTLALTRHLHHGTGRGRAPAVALPSELESE